MQPKYPVYIPSKGRAAACMTMRALDRLGVPYRVIVEAQEFDVYATAIGADNLLVLDPVYQRDYDACMNLEPNQSRGSGPARNFAWDHAVTNGYAWHWIVDDNISAFLRMYQNTKIHVFDGVVFAVVEDFAARYENVAMAGPNYESFANHRQRIPPFRLNTRIYSCNLIRNDVPFRWRGRYNEDTILSLDMLKAGFCTILVNAMLAKKTHTMTMKGGNTDELYRDGTLEKSRMLVREHPDVARLTWKFNRWHHHVDYRKFKHTKLIRKPDIVIPEGINDYGMRLVQIGAD